MQGIIFLSLYGMRYVCTVIEMTKKIWREHLNERNVINCELEGNMFFN